MKRTMFGNSIEIIGEMPKDSMLLEDIKAAAYKSLERLAVERLENPIFVEKMIWSSPDRTERGDTPSEMRTVQSYSIGCKARGVKE